MNQLIIKKIWLGILITLLSTTIRAQSVKLEWVKSMGGTDNEAGLSITTDSSGNVYVTGYYKGTVDFDPGAATFNLTSNGGWDIFIQKLDASGNFIWAKSMGGTYFYDAGFSITTDAVGNIYVTGIYQDTVDFDPGAATFNLASRNGSWDVFILKMDSSGNFIWAKSMGGTGYDYGRSISIDDMGNVLITGHYQDTADFDPGVSTFNLTSNGFDDVFIQKLDAAGNFLWAKSMGGTFDDYGYSIITDTSGNVLITGSYGDTVDFDPGAASFNLTANGYSDVFIQKLDAAGNFIWAKSMGGTSSDYSYAMATDTFGNIYITGSYRDTADFDPGAATFNLISNGIDDIFIQKLDPGGNFIWAKSIGGTSFDYGFSITTDVLGNVYVAGIYPDTVDFDPGAATFNLISNGMDDVFIQKLDPGGNFIWAKSIGGPSTDLCYSITTDALGNVLITGYYQDSVDFDPGAATFNLTSIGLEDFYIQKLTPCAPSTVTDIINACDSSTWIDGNTYISNNNTATHTLTNAIGCDSVVTLDLTITISNTGTTVITACDYYTWIDGNLYTMSNNVATHTLTNDAGCDSVVTLNLTINTVDVSVTATDPSITVNTTGASYQWLDCNNNYAIIAGDTARIFTASANGKYAVEVTENGCTDTSVCTSIATIDIEENTLFNSISIYPNPIQELVIIYLGNLREVSIKVFNVSGQLIYRAENINASSHQFKLNGATGIYSIELSSQGQKQQYKLVKE